MRVQVSSSYYLTDVKLDDAPHRVRVISHPELTEMLNKDPQWRKYSTPSEGLATATKVWKVECPCGTNWVYGELDSTLPDDCENCGRGVEVVGFEAPTQNKEDTGL